MYPYLTGSASWYLFTLVTEAYGFKGQIGDLVLTPKLMSQQFDQEGKTRLIAHFANREFEITYVNRTRLDFGEYQIGSVRLDDLPIDSTVMSVVIPRSLISSLDHDKSHRIEIKLIPQK